VRSPKEFCEGFVAQTGDLRRGMHARAEKNFVRVNVANARDQFLIEQNRLHRATMFFKDFPELWKTDVKRVRAEGAPFQELIDVCQQSDFTEFALILEREAMRVGENKEHSCMRRRLFVMLEIPERASHAEMKS